MTQAIFKTIDPTSLREKVAAALKDAFFSGMLKPGDVIVERRLASEMGVGTPTVREALISLQEQGFVRRIANTATHVTKFRPDEVRQLYLLRIELEVVALQWAKARVRPRDIEELRGLVDRLVEAGESGSARDFLERDLEFHGRYWELSGNRFLAETLKRLMTPLFVFVVLASGKRLDANMAREHYRIVEALETLTEPEFTAAVRETIGTFAQRWITSVGAEPEAGPQSEASTAPLPGGERT